MRRLHRTMSICLSLAVLGGGVAFAQDASSGSRLLRSVPLGKTEAVAKEPSKQRTPTRIEQQLPTRKNQIDSRTTAPRRASGRVQVNGQPIDATRAAPARSDTQTSQQTFAATLDALGGTAPYALSGSRRYLVAAEKSGRGLLLCDLSNQRRLRVLENSNRRYALLEISTDARWIAAVRRDDQDQIDLWRADNGRQFATLNAAGGAKRMLEFSDRGDELRVTANNGDGQVFGIPSGKLVGRFGERSGGSAVKTPSVRAPQLSPRVGAAPSSPGPTTDRLESASPAPTTRSYAVPKAAGPEPEAAAAAPAPQPTRPPASPEMQAPRAPTATSQPAPTTAAPTTNFPKESAPKKAAKKYAAPSEAPTMAAPALAEPRMAAPAPRAMMRESEDGDSGGGAEPPAAAAPSSIFDNITGALPEESAATPSEDTFSSPAGAEPTFDSVGGALPRAAAEPRPDAAAAPGSSSIDPGAESVAEAAAPPVEDEDKSSVTVHYATNRNRLASTDREWLVYFKGFFTTLPAFVVYALVVLSVLIFPWFGKRTWAGYAVVTGAVVLCAMGGLEAYVRSQLRDELSGELYGSRPMEVSYGACEVSVPLPENRQAGELNRPVSVWVFESPENPEKHFMLRKVTEHADQEAFFASLSTQFEKEGVPAALLFIHGYNVSFEDAIFRTAQLAVDLKFEGAPITFSWPSYADPVKYTFDEQNAEVSIPAFQEFLKDLAAKSGAERIHVIAHSMGNRVLAGALERMDPESQQRNKQVFREVVLAAPDIDRRVFESQVLPHIEKNAQHCTLYASSRDRALLISRYFHNYQRLGETEPELIVAKGMDTIDASLVDTSLLGHSYIGDVQSIVSDLHDLVIRGKLPMERLGLETLERGGLPYWTIRPQLETAADSSLHR